MQAMAVIAMATAALEFFNKLMDKLQAQKQNKVMTPEEDAAYNKLVEERMKLPHWQKRSS